MEPIYKPDNRNVRRFHADPNEQQSIVGTFPRDEHKEQTIHPIQVELPSRIKEGHLGMVQASI